MEFFKKLKKFIVHFGIIISFAEKILKNRLFKCFQIRLIFEKLFSLNRMENFN